MARRRPPPGKCAAYGELGRKKKRIRGSGRYSFCLSQAQKRELFGEVAGKRMACGTFACVWPSVNEQRVIKITRDRADVDGLLRAQGIERVVKVYRAFELKDAGTDMKTGKKIPIYAIEAERLTNIPRHEEALYQDSLEATRKVMLDKAKTIRRIDPKLPFSVSDELKSAIPQRACRRLRRPHERTSCEIFLGNYITAFEQLAQRGILWQDTHFGNIGLDAKGRWRALDLGYSGTKEHAEIPTLAGARRRRR
jgi:hypothetical protein